MKLLSIEPLIDYDRIAGADWSLYDEEPNKCKYCNEVFPENDSDCCDDCKRENELINTCQKCDAEIGLDEKLCDNCK